MSFWWIYGEDFLSDPNLPNHVRQIGVQVDAAVGQSQGCTVGDHLNWNVSVIFSLSLERYLVQLLTRMCEVIQRRCRKMQRDVKSGRKQSDGTFRPM